MHLSSLNLYFCFLFGFVIRFMCMFLMFINVPVRFSYKVTFLCNRVHSSHFIFIILTQRAICDKRETKRLIMKTA